MGLLQTVQRLAQRVGLDVIPRRYWSPVPFDVAEEIWKRRSPLAGIEFDVEAQTRLFSDLLVHADDYEPIEGRRMFGGMDALVLHCMIRHLEPGRVVELGSGVSTDIIRRALGRPHAVYDPFANDRTDLEVAPVSAVDVPLEVFTSLGRDDVLFVDTSHTVKTGCDVNRIVLEILPALQPGVVVHFHDIFLPFEYPKGWAERGLYWAEQYLLQAFLVGNREWEVLLGCAAVHDRARALVAGAVGMDSDARPGSFWLRRR